MINRKLIRIKTVQVIYSYCLNEGRVFSDSQAAGKGEFKEVCRPELVENNLLRSLGTAYDLYNTMLTLMVEISRLALRSYEAQLNRSKRLGLPEPNRKLIDNRFMLQLEGNRQLQENRQNQRIDWSNEEEFVRSIYNKVMDSDLYREYMDTNVSTYEEDREFWRKVYRHIIIDNDSIDSMLEDFNLYWNDDRFIIDTFVLKTINRFKEDSTDEHPLLPEFRNEEELEFARKLVRQSVMGADYYRSLIAESTRNWDVERVPVMDRVIMQVALAEITSFPTIPLSVSINEYIEIAKSYSTPNSGRYINATLDNISKKLIAEHKLTKSN